MNTLTTDHDAEVEVPETTEKDLLRFITCGSVDDGKSTLIGRLMLDAGAIPDDQIQALQRDSQKFGTNGEEIDTALLLDGLEDERQQGITIDVAYRYFTTGKRKFIIADTPGHEQFTRNMATGASTADLAVILVDAAKGISTQTKRHAFIVSLLGINHIVLAVNKMDLVGYSEQVFEQIRTEFSQFAAKLDVPDVRFVPLSALNGDNVVEPSSNTLWYSDGSLLHILETIYVAADRNLRDLRFPVQWVNRPDSGFRGFCGSISSGTLRKDDEVVVLPSRKKSRVRAITTMDGELEEARAPASITVQLEDEIDVTRGDVIVRPGNLPTVSREVEAMLVWMSDQPMTLHRQYWFKGSNRRTSCEVESLHYQVDVNTLHRQSAANLKLNEIGRCRIGTLEPVVFDPYRRNRETGAFILVDRITHETVAAGMILDQSVQHEELDIQSDYLKPRPVESLISGDQRHQQYGHKPFTLLITGLPCSGKTTLALALEQALFAEQVYGVVLDGEHLRTGISSDLGYSVADRSENLRRSASIAKMLNETGQYCIAAFAAPEEQTRQTFKQLVGMSNILHIHLTTSLETCRERDKTGRYDAAERGEIGGFPGLSIDYDVPEDADLSIALEGPEGENTTQIEQILQLLKERHFV